MGALVGARAQTLLRLRFGSRIAVGVSVTAAIAVATEALWIGAWRGAWSSDPLMVLLVVLGAAACHFPVELTPRFKTSAATAVYFTTLLLFPPPLAVGLVGLSVLLGNGTLALQRNSDGHRKRGAYDSIFNAAHMMISTGLGAAVLYALGGEILTAQPPPADVWAIPAAAGAMFTVDSGAVALMVGFHSGRNPLHIWTTTQSLNAASEAALYLIGFVTALVAFAHPWVPLAMVVPTAVVYLSTKRAVVLTQQTIEAVEAMADMVDMRDRYTAQHSQRVAANVAAIASAMGLSRENSATVRLAARVHDLGKIAVPDAVLLKEGKLTPQEFELMKGHSRHGYELLAKFPQYRRGREIVLAHHERIDGKGYPRGIRGDRIPLGAQIIAVADALDAMTSDRPYRAALPLHQAMTELRLGRGTQWSPAVVDTVDRLLNSEKRELSFGGALEGLQTA
jgi:HD-GYP domain-containing protein (c-di-GMP phosphodiesterase class II)